MKPLLLDLFCGAGGAAKGYHDAGFDVVGVDIKPQPRYPYAFIQGDALDLAPVLIATLRSAAIHASPPCQSESNLRHRTGVEYADLLTPTLEMLSRLSVPWVIENVASTAKLPGSLVLCGTEFGLHAQDRWLKRHRRFASNVFLAGAAGCNCTGRRIGGVYGTGGRGAMTRGYKFPIVQARTAMGIDWMTGAELSQAIPPAYTQFIGAQLIEHLS